MTKPFDLVQAAALEGSHLKLNETCHIITPGQQHLLSAVTQKGPWHFIDVPATAVIGELNPQRDAPQRPFNWREAALSLHCKGWEQADIEYLEQPMRVRPMPVAPGARYSLKLTSYAGAVICTNGVHRLAAAIAWQLRPGSTGLLNLAATHVLSERDGRVQAIIDLGQQGELDFAEVSAPAHMDQMAELAGTACNLAVRVRGGHCEGLLAFPTAGGPAIELKARSWLERKMASKQANEARSTGWFDWAPIPPEFMSAWRNRGWLDGSLARGENVGDSEPHGPMFA